MHIKDHYNAQYTEKLHSVLCQFRLLRFRPIVPGEPLPDTLEKSIVMKSVMAENGVVQAASIESIFRDSFPLTSNRPTLPRKRQNPRGLPVRVRAEIGYTIALIRPLLDRSSGSCSIEKVRKQTRTFPILKVPG